MGGLNSTLMENKRLRGELLRAKAQVERLEGELRRLSFRERYDEC